LPLLSKENFNKWVMGRESTWDGIRKELYDECGAGAEESNAAAVPCGLVALWNLMTSSRNFLVGPEAEFGSTTLGQLIGFGAFATVHISKNSEQQVVKLSRYGAKAMLDQEAKVLRALQQQQHQKGIVRMITYENMSIPVGGIGVQLPALTLAPRGISSAAYLASSSDKVQALFKIGWCFDG
jgi:hypothetical protein